MNRLFKYGDGIFESMRAIGGNIPLWQGHYARLSRALVFLKIAVPDEIFLKNALYDALHDTPNARVRLSLWRAGGGLLTPETHDFAFLIDVQTTKNTGFSFDANGLAVGIFDEIRLQKHLDKRFSSVKLANSLPYILAACAKKEQGYNDILLCNEHHEIVEAMSSNVLIVKDNTLYITDSEKWGLRGVMQNLIVNELAQQLDLQIDTTSWHTHFIADADEIILTNAVQGIRYVRTVAGRDTVYKSAIARALHEALCQYLTTT